MKVESIHIDVGEEVIGERGAMGLVPVVNQKTIYQILSCCDEHGKFALDKGLIESPSLDQAVKEDSQMVKGTVRKVWYSSGNTGGNGFNFGQFHQMGRPCEVVERIPVNYTPVYGANFKR